MSPDYVGALNLVEIEFSNDPTVMQFWRQIINHLGIAHARGGAGVEAG
jgi:hypothetical protein